MAYRNRKLGGKVNLSGTYKQASNEDVINRINSLEKNVLIAGGIASGIIVLLQVIQLYQSGQIKSITEEQKEIFNAFKEEANKNGLGGLSGFKDLSSLLASVAI